MNHALKRFAYLLQLCLLSVCLTTGLVALALSDQASEAFHIGEDSTSELRADAPFTTGERIQSDYAFHSKTSFAETGLCETEEEEESFSHRSSFKIPSFFGGYGTTSNTGLLALAEACPASLNATALTATVSFPTRTHVRFQVFRI